MVSWHMALCHSCFLSYVPFRAASILRNCYQTVSNIDALIPGFASVCILPMKHSDRKIYKTNQNDQQL